MPLAGKSGWIVWVLGPLAVAVALLAQLVAAARTGLLAFDQSFGAGKDGDWLTLLATITGLAAITSALSGLVVSGMVSGFLARYGVIVLVAVAGLASLPFLHAMADDARDVGLAIGGPENSVTVALIIGLGLGALTAGVISGSNWKPAAVGLAVTTAGLWMLIAVSGRTAVGPAPLGLPSDLLRTRNVSQLGGWLPLPAVLWVVIGAAAALAARRFTAGRGSVLLSGVLGSALISLSYFAARPGESYGDHLTVHNSAFGLTIMLVGGALLGAGIVSLAPTRGAHGADTGHTTV
ncbi:hypothetical protein [Micromonospora avicenniae]|uniref:hypothetical protein n=1 Tax=Micromonospora avicenniae TaxID=1198245 RepID=UPI00344410E0